MRLNQIKSKRKNKKRIRVGRGIAAGQGKTAGRGTKGEKSRTGFKIPKSFEGGQTPLIRRLPKRKGFRGFDKPLIVKIGIIEKYFKEGETVSPKSLCVKGLVKDTSRRIKILGGSKLSKPLKFTRCAISKSVKRALEKGTKDDKPKPSHV